MVSVLLPTSVWAPSPINDWDVYIPDRLGIIITNLRQAALFGARADFGRVGVEHAAKLLAVLLVLGPDVPWRAGEHTDTQSVPVLPH